MLDARVAHMGRCSRAEWQNRFANKVIDEATAVHYASCQPNSGWLQYARVQRSDWGYLIVTLT